MSRRGRISGGDDRDNRSRRVVLAVVCRRSCPHPQAGSFVSLELITSASWKDYWPLGPFVLAHQSSNRGATDDRNNQPPIPASGPVCAGTQIEKSEIPAIALRMT